MKSVNVMEILKGNRSVFFVAVLLLITARPYFVWPLLNTYSTIAVYVLIFLLTRKYISSDGKSKKLITLYIFTWILYVLICFIHGANIYGIIEKVPFCLFCILPFLQREYSKKLFDVVLEIYCIVVAISLVMYFLYLAGILSPIGQISHPSQKREYIHYPFLLVENLFFESFRFYGVFDEPGVIGTTSAILLSINRFNFKDWRTYLLLLSGIMSMSMFFYALVSVVCVVYYVFVRKAFIQSFILIALGTTFFITTRDNDLIYDTIWKRFEWNSSEGKFEGDSRMNTTSEAYYDKIVGTSKFYWGDPNSADYFATESGNSSSYKNVIIVYGFVFFFLYSLFFVLLSRYHHLQGFSLFVYLFILGLNTYQRPDIYYPFLIFIYGYLAWSLGSEKSLVHK